MIIKRETLKKIIDFYTGFDYISETGGIIGGMDGIITEVEFDAGIREKCVCKYTPNTLVLNKVINERWIENDRLFMGIFHTHYAKEGKLSKNDIYYINRIMAAMPEGIKELFFPIVLFPSLEIVSYLASTDENGFLLKKDEIRVV